MKITLDLPENYINFLNKREIKEKEEIKQHAEEVLSNLANSWLCLDEAGE